MYQSKKHGFITLYVTATDKNHCSEWVASLRQGEKKGKRGRERGREERKRERERGRERERERGRGKRERESNSRKLLLKPYLYDNCEILLITVPTQC